MLMSIFPKIPFLAMTATATLKMKKDVSTSLGMIDPTSIEASPDRPNIYFSASQRPDRGDDKLTPILTPLIEELKAKRLSFPLTIVYGTLQVIGDCFLFASNVMGSSQYEPVGSSHDAVNRLFTQFHAQYPEHERERIIQELVSGTSKLRLLFVTVLLLGLAWMSMIFVGLFILVFLIQLSNISKRLVDVDVMDFQHLRYYTTTLMI